MTEIAKRLSRRTRSACCGSTVTLHPDTAEHCDDCGKPCYVQAEEAPRYIIVDNPNGPLKYWKAAPVGHACQEARAIERERCARIAETINDSIKHKGLFAKIILNPNTCIIPLNNGTNALNVEHLPDNGNQCVYCGEYLDNSYDASQRLITELVEALNGMIKLWAITQPVLGSGRRNVESDSQVIRARAVIAKAERK